jgi:hypothetical protein
MRYGVTIRYDKTCHKEHSNNRKEKYERLFEAFGYHYGHPAQLKKNQQKSFVKSNIILFYTVTVLVNAGLKKIKLWRGFFQ